MPKSKRKLKIRLTNKGSIVRLGILFLLLFLVGLWGWLSMFWIPGQSYRATLPPLDENAIALKEALQKDVQTIAKAIGARNDGHYERLNRSRTFLATSLAQAGYEVRQKEYTIEGKVYSNLEVEKLGTEKPKEIVIIGGHYDSAFASPLACSTPVEAILSGSLVT